ncbi:adherens junction-associated protein 1 [Eucyclogobius newberryi]|uniref:adherens junction-associated protein 1 n=1 Tax=Eucyclogobius newberryi TaxID=166745 RepID=UPI003B5A4ECC
MWINAAVVRSGTALRPSCSMGQRVWILLAMTHLTFDLSPCSALSPEQLRLTPPPAPRPRPRNTPSLLHWRTVGPLSRRALSPAPLPQEPRPQAERRRRAPHKDPSEVLRLLLRTRRQLKWDSISQEGRTTTVSGFIDWGPTGTDEGPDERNFTTSVSAPTLSPTTSATPRHPHRTVTVVTQEPKHHSTTRAPATGETVKPAKPYGDTPGLAVHQIITITVSLIMVIAALITTLVLKNCCAQSGNSRHNSHQRKIHQQEESCQNLTDFTPARVPSKVDIFTAYDSLQCSHECLRGGVPIYTDEMIQQTPVYKSAYNGNRPSPTERQLIPVAFVSEKWFEISC